MAISGIINGYSELVEALRRYIQRSDDLTNQFVEVLTKHATETKDVFVLELLLNFLRQSQQLTRSHSEILDILGTAMREPDDDDSVPPKR